MFGLPIFSIVEDNNLNFDELINAIDTTDIGIIMRNDNSLFEDIMYRLNNRYSPRDSDSVKSEKLQKTITKLFQRIFDANPSQGFVERVFNLFIPLKFHFNHDDTYDDDKRSIVIIQEDYYIPLFLDLIPENILNGKIENAEKEKYPSLLIYMMQNVMTNILDYNKRINRFIRFVEQVKMVFQHPKIDIRVQDKNGSNIFHFIGQPEFDTLSRRVLTEPNRLLYELLFIQKTHTEEKAQALQAKDNQGNTPLMVLTQSLSPDNFLVALQYLMNSNQKIGSIASIQNNDGDTLIHLAVQNGNCAFNGMLTSVWYYPLIQIGGNAFAIKNKEGATCLHIACLLGFTRIVEMLKPLLSDIYLNDKDIYGNTPADYAHLSVDYYPFFLDSNLKGLNPLMKAVADNAPLWEKSQMDPWINAHHPVYGFTVFWLAVLLKRSSWIDHFGNFYLNNPLILKRCGNVSHLAISWFSEKQSISSIAENQAPIERTLTVPASYLFQGYLNNTSPIDVAIIVKYTVDDTYASFFLDGWALGDPSLRFFTYHHQILLEETKPSQITIEGDSFELPSDQERITALFGKLSGLQLGLSAIFSIYCPRITEDGLGFKFYSFFSDPKYQSCMMPASKQGECNTCYAFALAGMLSNRTCKALRDNKKLYYNTDADTEAKLVRTKPDWKLSPQQIISCTSEGANCKVYGWAVATFETVANEKALLPQKCAPYISGTDPNASNSAHLDACYAFTSNDCLQTRFQMFRNEDCGKSVQTKINETCGSKKGDNYDTCQAQFIPKGSEIPCGFAMDNRIRATAAVRGYGQYVMAQEIMKHGPIYAMMIGNSRFFTSDEKQAAKDAERVFRLKDSETIVFQGLRIPKIVDGAHVVQICGYGTVLEDGELVEFWLVENSFGNRYPPFQYYDESKGENVWDTIHNQGVDGGPKLGPFIRMIRGPNDLGLDTALFWASRPYFDTEYSARDLSDKIENGWQDWVPTPLPPLTMMNPIGIKNGLFDATKIVLEKDQGVTIKNLDDTVYILKITLIGKDIIYGNDERVRSSFDYLLAKGQEYLIDPKVISDDYYANYPIGMEIRGVNNSIIVDFPK